MAAITLRYINAKASGCTNAGSMGETDQTLATSTSGWTCAKTAAANSANFQEGTEQISAVFSTESGTNKPTAITVVDTAHVLRSQNPYTGTFDIGNWVLTVVLRSVTAAAGTVRIRARVYRSTSATGTPLTELTAATQVGTTSAAMSTTVDTTSAVTWAPGTTITLNNEYLIVTLALEIMTAGSSNSSDVLLRTGTSANGTRFVTPNLVPKLEGLVDRFATTVDKAVTWNNTSAATVWDSSGRAKLPCTSAYSLLGTLAATPSYNFTGSYLYAKPTLPPYGTGTRELFMEIFCNAGATDKVHMYVSGSNLNARRVVASAVSHSTFATYDSVAHAWWRIRESAGTIYFDTSPDSINWTNFFTCPTSGITITDTRVNFSCGYYGTETASDGFVDNVNVPYVYGTTSLTLTSTITSSGEKRTETLIDDFNRADGNIAAGAGASVWTSTFYNSAVASDLRTIGNQLGWTAATWASAYTQAQVQADFDVLLDCIVPPATPTNNEFGVYVLNPVGVAGFAGYAVFCSGGNWILRRYAAGASAGNIATIAGSLIAGDSLWWYKRGSTQRIYKRSPSFVFQDRTDGGYTWGNTTSIQARAQSFTMPGTAISEVKLRLSKTGAPADNLIIEIQSNSGTLPSGTVVGTVATVAGTTLTTIATEYTYSGLNISGLTSGATYWLVIRRSGAFDAANYYVAGGIGSTPAGWTACKEWNGSVWNNGSSTMWLRVQGNQVGTGTFSLILSGTDANFNLAGQVAIELSDATQRWDNLRGAFIPTGPTTRFGSATLALTDNRVTAGTRKTFGSSTTALTDAVTTSGRRIRFGTSVVAETATITTAGVVRKLAATTTVETVSITTAGKRTTKGTNVVASAVTISTSAVRKTFGVSAIPLSATITTAGWRKRFGQSVVAETVTITTNGQVSAGHVTYFGTSVVALTDTISTQGWGGVQVSDSFSAFTTGETWADGTTHGIWYAAFNGFGVTQITDDGAPHGKTLQMEAQPPASSDPADTHASLVRSLAVFPYEVEFTVDIKTVAQLRPGGGQAWERAWVVWNYTDDAHFYYLALKTNGLEVGKRDPAYGGGQRFLPWYQGTNWPLGTWNQVRVRQIGPTIEIFVDGVRQQPNPTGSLLVDSFTDTERPYTSGQIGLYHEDSRARFDNVVATSPVSHGVQQYGTVVAAFNDGITTAGRRKTFGVISVPLTDTITTAVKRKTFAVSTAPFSVAITTAGRRRTTSATVVSLNAVIVTAGVVSTGPVTRFGTSVVTLTDSISTSGKRKTFAVSTAPFTDTITTAGRRIRFAASVVALTDTITTAGFRKTFSTSTVPLSVSIVTSGVKTGSKIGTVVFQLNDVITTASRVTRKAQSSFVLTDTITTIGQITKHGSSVLPLTDVITTSARRVRLGQIVVALTDVITTSSRRLTYGQITFPIIVTIVTIGRAQTGAFDPNLRVLLGTTLDTPTLLGSEVYAPVLSENGLDKPVLIGA